MRSTWNGITIDAIDYEVIRLSSSDATEELGAFSDVHVSAAPMWRLVAGYLMLASVNPDELGIFSHGRLAASLRLDEEGILVRAAGAGSWEERGDSVRTSGVALVPGNGLRITDDGVRLSASAPWQVSIVHGPAEQKIDARIELLASLGRVGGRRG
ncbi:hypothetical protein [Microbacterium sp.]|uniref:hypothetical protein n=1 Tax=Microbacterium sp. TaxID=51671 RepID=UPI002810B682|nr:hypothetical protein [Microbacterium sp.]